jgi:hypothetical protein
VLPWWAGAGAFRRQRDLPGSAHCLRNHIGKRVPIAAGHCLPLGGMTVHRDPPLLCWNHYRMAASANPANCTQGYVKFYDSRNSSTLGAIDVYMLYCNMKPSTVAQKTHTGSPKLWAAHERSRL